MSTQAQIESYIIQVAVKNGVPVTNARIIASQAAHETGNFTSRNFVLNNNAFGMAIPRIRKSPYISTGSSVSAPADEGGFAYAKYDSLENSVRDLIHWLKYNNVDWKAVDDTESYAAWLKSKGYYTADQSLYAAALGKAYARIKDIVVKYPGTTLTLIVGVALLGIGTYIYMNRKKVA